VAQEGAQHDYAGQKQASGLVHQGGTYRLVRRSDDPRLLQINATIDGRRYRLGVGTDVRQAKRKLFDFIAEMESGHRPRPDAPDIDWWAICQIMTRRQKNAAKGRGIPFSIGPQYVFSLMRETGFRCAVSGIPFSRAERKTWEVDPWAPSIDRIDNHQGYLIDNVRVVTAAANYAMNRWGFDMLLRLAKGVVRNAGHVLPEPGAA